MANHYKNIVVAVDGSKEGHYAFRKSIDVAKRNEGAVLHIANIVDNRTPLESPAVDHISQQSVQLVNDYKEQALAEGINNVNIISKNGSPRTAISKDIAETVEADLIICGATGHNVVERFLIGSVSESIVRTATCDVLVIRTKE